MSKRINILEVYRTAERIEENGGRFYRQAAEMARDENTRRLLSNLAAMEDDHAATFADMRAKLEEEKLDPASFDLSETNSAFMEALTSQSVFDMSEDATELALKSASIDDILHLAIQREKDSVVYYMGIRDHIPENWGIDRISSIIQEEMDHVAMLSQALTNIYHI